MLFSIIHFIYIQPNLQFCYHAFALADGTLPCQCPVLANPAEAHAVYAIHATDRPRTEPKCNAMMYFPILHIFIRFGKNKKKNAKNEQTFFS